METLITQIIRFGELSFPVVVAAYLLIRMDKRIDLLTQAINDLRTAYSISVMTKVDKNV
jgi:hypothetical protein